MKLIVRRSTLLVTFVGLLGLTLSSPQRQHVERFADLLVVAPRRKTLAQLAALELQGVDASNLADFLRISPWDADDLRLPLVDFIIRYLQDRCNDPNIPIFFTLDDSLTPKDKATRRLQSVDWHFDHNQQRTIRGGNHVVLGIHWGPFHFPLLWRLYMRQSTVRRLNRRRQHTKLRYKSKLELAKQMLAEVHSRLPAGRPVYVLFDSWYTSASLVKWIRQQNWHVIAAVKSNRTLNRLKLTDWHKLNKGTHYAQVALRLANGRNRTYWVRSVVGRLKGVPGSVRVVFSQKGPGAQAPKYFLCSDTTLSLQKILSWYQKRWSQEVDYWYVKRQLGLGDFRVQGYETIEKWYAVVYLTLVYLYWRSYQEAEEDGHIASLSDVLQAIREQKACEVLEAACKEAAAGQPIAEILARYLETEIRLAG